MPPRKLMSRFEEVLEAEKYIGLHVAMTAAGNKAVVGGSRIKKSRMAESSRICVTT
jgi:hypothetical protein